MIIVVFKATFLSLEIHSLKERMKTVDEMNEQMNELIFLALSGFQAIEKRLDSSSPVSF